MPLNPFTLKQMKDGTLATLRLQGQPLDERDYKMLNGYIRTTQSLKSLDLTYCHGAFEQLSDSIRQNQSITSLSLGQVVQDHNISAVIDVLKANPGITSLTLDNNYFQGPGISQLARFLKDRAGLTHLSMENVQTPDDDMADDFPRGRRGGMGRGAGGGSLDRIAKALATSPNILEFAPSNPDLEPVCEANRAAAEALLKSALAAPDQLNAADVESFRKRLPLILYLAENEVVRDRGKVAELLLGVEDAALHGGVAFTIPGRYEDLAAALPKPFRPAAEKVDFGALAAPLADPEIYKAVEAGQTDELLAHLSKNGRKLTVADCLLKPEGKRENLIELIARQGKLANVMTVDNWLGDPRGLKAAAAAVPIREWRRQMKDVPVEQLIYQVNAVSFKKLRMPAAKP
jgi:hypothetical protein